jgi:hypothetical protein
MGPPVTLQPGFAWLDQSPFEPDDAAAAFCQWRYHHLPVGSKVMTTAFIRHPGRSGPFGALMDEYARAAEDFCRVVERFDLTRFDGERPSNDPNTVSPRAICLHVIGAEHRYAHYVRKALGVDFVDHLLRHRRQLERW